MRWSGSGRQRAKRPAVWLAAGALLILSSLFVVWWQADRLSPIFPPLLESLDRQVWAYGGEGFFLERYTSFHQGIIDLRSRWRKEQHRWWPTADTQTFQTTYHHLAQEGAALLEATQQQKSTRKHQLSSVLESERRQVNRLRALTGFFDLRRSLRTLSVTEGLLNQAASRLQQDRYDQAGILLGQASESLKPVESQAMDQMKRYGATPQLSKWNNWVASTLDWSLRTGGTAIVVLKAPRQLLLYQHGKPHRRFPIELGFSGLQDKLQEGDGATPEGQFRILHKKGPGATKFHKALLLNYPTREHRRRFQEAKVRGVLTSNRAIGSLIEIHGQQPNGNNTTNGCIALENADMDVVFQLAQDGTPVTVVGAVQSDNWVVNALHNITEHARHRIALTTESGSVLNR